MKKVLLVLQLIVVSFALSAQDTAKAIRKVAYPKGYTEQLNVVYKTVDEWQGLMDLYLPPAGKSPSALLINIHGGGWNTGSKEMDSYFGSYFKKGYAVANINYRLAGTAPAPAAIEDSRCAIIYLINQAKQLNIDTKRIVLCGTSAGGHLALLAGMLGNNKVFDSGCTPVEPIKIAAIVDKWGISDVVEWGFGAKGPGNNAVKRWLGNRSGDTAFARQLSPLAYINKETPPVFIAHGDADPVVPYTQSASLYQELNRAGVKTVLFTIPEGRHGNIGQEYSRELNNRLVAFLDELGL
jgi:acetyl esterase/lipase